MKYPIMNNLNTDFKMNNTYSKYIDDQMSAGKDFLFSLDGVPISKEYPEKEVSSEIYDKIWDKKPHHNNVHPYMSIMAELCKKHSPDVKHIIDVGAGFGNMAIMFIDKIKPLSYTAYEFSNAHEKITERFKNVSCETNVIVDSFRECSLEKFDCVVATEIFEHICWDIEFLSKIPSGTYIYFSVPSHHSIVHVRAFLVPESIYLRYDDVVDIIDIKTVYRHKDIPKWWCVAARKK